MSDPDVRVVVQGIKAAEQRVEHLLRERNRVERLAEEARRALAKIDRQLVRLERELRRGPRT